MFGDAVDRDWAGRGGRADLVVAAGSEGRDGAGGGSGAVNRLRITGDPDHTNRLKVGLQPHTPRH